MSDMIQSTAWYCGKCHHINTWWRESGFVSIQ